MKLLIHFGGEHVPSCGWYAIKQKIREGIAQTLTYEHFPFDAEVSLTFCDNASIRAKNAKFRGKDTATDVLSFPMYEREELQHPDELPVFLGDIVISVERAAEQAKMLGHSTEREEVFLAIHSVLHLLGYDHERSPEEDEDMCRRQREILRLVYQDEPQH